MIPITRKELYLNKIVGNNEYETPEKPISEEEFFFAEILGEAVQAPEPLTRYQLYLAKIAGKNIEIPYPETRLEYFLARAAGMDVETPVPITREEIYWSNYTATTEFELEGVPPLIFRSDGSALKNYRIYGAAWGIGDYDEESGKYVIPVTIAGKNKFDGTLFSGYYTDSTMTSIGGVSGNYKSCKVYLSAGTYTFSCSVSVLIIRYITSDIYRSNPIGSKYTQEYTFTLANDSYVSLAFRNESNTAWDDSTTIQIEEAQTATEYEPYHEPIVSTISLETPLSEGESVSMAETGVQFGTIDGTNILTVGTEVQPSKVYLKGKIEEIPTRTVSYYSQDGSTLLGTETVESGGNASGLQDTPTKPDTEQYTYTFVGWSNTTNATTAMSGILNNITADKSVYAAFSETEKTFTVTFYNGEELIYTVQNVSYNGTAVYSGDTPTKAETAQYTYTFAGWNSDSSASTADTDALKNVTTDREVYAIFTQVEKAFTVTFYNGDTVVDKVSNIAYNGTATYGGETPTKASTAQYDYTFAGWTKTQGGTTVDADALTNVVADRNVYAVFTATVREYTVTFYNASTLLDSVSVAYGSNAVYSGDMPTKTSTAQYEYSFLGWNADSTASSADSGALNNITGNKTVYAIFSQAERSYTVSYYSQDGQTLIDTESVVYGHDASFSGTTPAKASTAQYDYTFAGWTKTQGSTTVDADALTGVTADRNVYAVFTATARSYTVTFMNVSTLMDTQTVTYGGTAVYGGITPTKAETSEYTYAFAGWNTNSSASTADADALTNVTADRTVYAIFTAVSKGYTVYFYNGETLLETVTGVPSGGTATYTGATPTKSGYVFTGWSPSPTNIQADTACYAQFKEDEMYESITDTWSQIIANVSNGTYSTKYHIGDTKKIDLGTEGKVIMQIVGIDADGLADNSGKAPITWISKQLLKTNHRMNPVRQSGTSGTGALGGWAACEMRNYLINTIKPLLPSEVRNALKTVKKYSRIYNTSGTAVNNVVSNDDIWIPSAYEMNTTGYETSGVTYSTAFPDNASRIKHKVGDPATWWWLRSADTVSAFRRVTSDGRLTDYNANYSYGVAVGFAI